MTSIRNHIIREFIPRYKRIVNNNIFKTIHTFASPPFGRATLSESKGLGLPVKIPLDGPFSTNEIITTSPIVRDPAPKNFPCSPNGFEDKGA